MSTTKKRTPVVRKYTKPSNAQKVKHTLKTLESLASIVFYEIKQTRIGGDVIKTLQKEISMDNDKMADVLGVKSSGYFNILKKKQLNVDQVDTLTNFAKVWYKGLESFEHNHEDFSEFLHSKNRNLGGSKPIDLLTTESGRRELSDAFDRIEYGLYG